MSVAFASHDKTLARRVWLAEEAAFVAGARWTPVSAAQGIAHSELPEVWDASFVARVPPHADVRLLIDGTRRFLLQHGCSHIKILLDDPSSFSTVGTKLVQRGLYRRTYATLAAHSLPKEAPVAGVVRFKAVRNSADRAELASIREAVRRPASWYCRAVGRALDAWEDLQQATLDLTWIAAYLDDAPAAAAGLLITKDGASLQSLATVPTLRQKGVASALVRDVVRRALQSGSPFVGLLTDANDTPRRLYKRLGFQDVGIVQEYLQSLS